MMKQRKRVFLISSIGDCGGIDQWTENIIAFYNSLKESNIILKHFYPQNAKSSFNGDSLLTRLYKGIFNYSQIIVHFYKEISQCQYDILHLSSNGSLGLIKDYVLFKMAKRKSIKTILHCHYGRIPDILKTTSRERFLLQKVLSLSDIVVTMDKYSYNALSDGGYKNIVWIPNPLSQKVADLANLYSTNFRATSDVLFVGHVVKTKGFIELLDACSMINNIKLHIIGPILDPTIIDYANKKNLNCHFEGTLSQEEVVNAMCSTSLFVLPSYSEGFPNVIIEAMACSCPIVATNVGAIPTMLDIDNPDKICGKCIAPKDTIALRFAISELLHNENIAKIYGTRARKKVNDAYSIETVWQQLSSVWNNL